VLYKYTLHGVLPDQPSISSSGSKSFPFLNSSNESWFAGVVSFCTIDDAKARLKDDSFTCLVELSSLQQIGSSSQAVERSSIAHDLTSLLLANSKHDLFAYSDIVLRVSDANGQPADVRAHKNILAARSPVFRAMFKHQMKVRRFNCSNI